MYYNTFTQAVELLRSQSQFYLPLIEQGMIGLTVEESSFRFKVKNNKDFPMASYFASQVIRQGPTAAVEMYLSACLLAEGPKVLAFDADACRAMEHMELNFPSEDYGQPFPTVAIDLPEKVQWENEVNGSRPIFTLARYERDKTLLLVATHFKPSGVVLSRSVKLVAGQSAEEGIREAEKVWNDSIPVSQEEWEVATRMVRVAVNASLLATNYGCKRVGYVNPSRGERLERLCRKKNAHTEANREELRMLPIRYEISQDVSLYRHEKSEREHGHSGRHVSSHWRRGHWRRQPVGAGRQERRLILIPAVLVNAHLFAGELSDTKVVCHV